MRDGLYQSGETTFPSDGGILINMANEYDILEVPDDDLQVIGENNG